MKAQRILFFLMMICALFVPINILAAEEEVVIGIQGMTCDL